jgi:hypothetical protein
MHLTEREAIIPQVVPVTNRGRIEHVSEHVLVVMIQRSSSFVGTAESSTKPRWKSLDRRVGTEWVSQSDAKTSRILDALYTLQSFVLRGARCGMQPSAYYWLPHFWGSVVLTRHP